MDIKWLIKMAWRDSRRNFSRLLLFISSVILGIAALVSIFSLSDTLSREIDQQAATLIGADLDISTNKKISEKSQKTLDSIQGKRSEQKSFSSMVYFPSNGGTRLIQVRALSGDYPYYGSLDTKPANAGREFQRNKTAIVDKALLLQFNIKVGDSVKIGERGYIVSGSLEAAPGQTGLGASVAPVVYIPLSTLPETALDQKGSRISTTFYYKLDNPQTVKTLVDKIEPGFRSEGIDIDTIESKKEQTARSFRDLARFLSLIGFIALLLGCIGVASAIHIYVREKINSIAVLRCLGTTSLQAFLIFLIQIIVIGLIGSVVGVLLGTVIHQFLPLVLKELLPVELHPMMSWSAVWKGLVLGLIISVLFALLPLVSIRNISPLNTLRISYQPELKRDVFSFLVYALIIGFIFFFTRLQLKNWKEAMFFTLGVIIAFGALTLIAKALMWTTRKFFPTSWSYLWRQGLSNLYRPNNQTTILLVSIGLGTALISTLIIIQSLLLNRVTLSSSGNQPNIVLFDIQTAQREKVMALTRQQGLEVNGTVPIVNMRLESINNINAASLEKDSTIKIQPWVFSREYRATFRDSLISSEKITKGKWTGKADTDKVIVSIEEGYGKRNGIEIGDTMIFNVQGSIIKTIVGSYRKVDWNRIQTNFLVVFPTGVLENAPQFHVLLTHVPSVEASAKFQQVLVRTFPNISVIDLGLVLGILDNILSKIGFVIRFMAGFCIVTGLIVLIASVLISKYQRIQESVLLRTLGAERKQVYMINAIEYFFIGALAATTGIVLSLLAGWALAYFSFEMNYGPDPIPLLIIFIVICALTVFIGLMNIRTVVSRSPLEILRTE
ncbi:MAG TPA: FtsX-like permease family protein [Chitinophagaceae bacterium]|nr:FtsX-like permease family protein [Chitinophagaceae bacterium]